MGVFFDSNVPENVRHIYIYSNASYLYYNDVTIYCEESKVHPAVTYLPHPAYA